MLKVSEIAVSGRIKHVSAPSQQLRSPRVRVVRVLDLVDISRRLLPFSWRFYVNATRDSISWSFFLCFSSAANSLKNTQNVFGNLGKICSKKVLRSSAPILKICCLGRVVVNHVPDETWDAEGSPFGFQYTDDIAPKCCQHFSSLANLGKLSLHFGTAVHLDHFATSGSF